MPDSTKQKMTTHTVKVINEEIEYYLEADTEPQLTIGDDENIGSLVFFGAYEPYEKDGPWSKFIIALDNIINNMVNDGLVAMGRGDLKMTELESSDEFEMETCYVLPSLCNQIKRSELRKHKMTRYCVPVKRRQSLSSTSSSSDEEDVKEVSFEKREEERVGKKRKL